MSLMFPGDLQEGYFFCTRGSKYLSGVRARRATRCGYWKSTGKDKAVHGRDGRLVGRRKTLVFYRRRDAERRPPPSAPARPDPARRGSAGGRHGARCSAGRGMARGGRRRRARLGTARLFFNRLLGV